MLKELPVGLQSFKSIRDNDYNYLIEVDGGINDITSKECIKAGADILVAGSYILKSDNYEERRRGEDSFCHLELIRHNY